MITYHTHMIIVVAVLLIVIIAIVVITVVVITIGHWNKIEDGIGRRADQHRHVLSCTRTERERERERERGENREDRGRETTNGVCAKR